MDIFGIFIGKRPLGHRRKGGITMRSLGNYKRVQNLLAVVSLSIAFLLIGFISFSEARQDRPKIPKGQSLPAPKVVRSAKAALHTAVATSIVFEEDFEAGGTSWSTDGSWAIGSPTGRNCAATDLRGNYPNYADDWLISPSISLPAIVHLGAEVLGVV